jgi:hypothetical protein
MARLEHLVLIPNGGWANRLRAIASARRLAARERFRLTVVWTWGDPLEYFKPVPSIEWVAERPPAAGSYEHRRHLLQGEGGNLSNRVLDLEGPNPGVVLSSCYNFGARNEPAVASLRPLAAHLLEHPPSVTDKVHRFKHLAFTGRVVGMHIRRTDNTRARQESPDRLFHEEARRLVNSGARIFLATDNVATETAFRQAFGRSIINYPKRHPLAERWPRRDYDPVDALDDLVDLLLLAASDYVLGCAGSSFSEHAIVLNGNPRSQVVH